MISVHMFMCTFFIVLVAEIRSQIYKEGGSFQQTLTPRDLRLYI